MINLWSPPVRSALRAVAIGAGLVLGVGEVSAGYLVTPELRRECEVLRQRMVKEAKSAEAHFELAICLSLMGSIEESRDALETSKKVDPEFRRRALPVYLERFRQQPDDPRTAYRLACVYYFNDKPEEALHYFSVVAEHQPVGQINAWAFGYMGVLKGEQKKWEEAEQLARKGIGLERDAYALHLVLALALKGQGRYLAALDEYFIATRLKDEATPSKTMLLK